MRRGEFITLLGAAALSFVSGPQAARAQRSARDGSRLVGILIGIANDADGRARMAALRDGLQQLGWSEGRNLRIEGRWSAGDADLMDRNLRELLQLRPDVLFVAGSRALSKLQSQVENIPIVMVAASDPAAGGFNAGLARPPANVTGFTQLELSVLGKMLGLLQQCAPQTKRVALLLHPDNGNFGAYRRMAIEAAQKIGMTAVAPPFTHERELGGILAAIANEPGGGVLVPLDSFVSSHRNLLVALANHAFLPLISPYRPFVAAGSLISYGADPNDIYRRSAAYVERILRGEQPGDLPIQAPVKYELVINLKTARALGLTLSPTLRALADEVIE